MAYLQVKTKSFVFKTCVASNLFVTRADPESFGPASPNDFKSGKIDDWVHFSCQEHGRNDGYFFVILVIYGTYIDFILVKQELAGWPYAQ